MMDRTAFQEIIWEYYRTHKRDMPWRANPIPYYVLVSELMLQQTQVSRVIPKFNGFITRFPDIKSLANASLAVVLQEWSGLGYNRRAKFLWMAARAIEREFKGSVPSTITSLVTLPGIGPNTAGAILAYAFEQRVIFIETNIRTVIIHHFFADTDDKITDSQIREYVEHTLPTEHVREWYWALMDYGSYIKATHGAQLGRIQGHKPQTTFTGSRRQIRGQIVRLLLKKPHTEEELLVVIKDDRLHGVLNDLQKEALINTHGGQWHLTGEDR